MSLFNLKSKAVVSVAVTLILTGYQLARVIAFVSVYGGIEHDGGWMLSISRSLAEQGSYTTMVSTIIDPDVPGGMNVDEKFDIQAADGRIWFFTGNGIGPASIVPDALILKLFGTDFWALHLGPLLFYTCFLLLAAYIVYQLAGLAAVVLLHVFLFFYPHLSIFLGYEAMGETPGMVYVLWAYLAFAVAMQKRRPRRWFFLVAGLIAGLAVNAKLIALWSVSGVFIWAGLLWLVGWFLNFRRPRFAPVRLSTVVNPTQDSGLPNPPRDLRDLLNFSRQPHFDEILLLIGGLMMPLALWELVHLVVLTRLTNFELYLRHVEQRIKFVLDDGSGVGLQIYSGPEFFWDKFFLLSEVTHPERWVIALVFIAILVGGATLLWLWHSQAYKQNLLALIWLGWLVNTIWFVTLAKTGWPRHFWFGLVLAALLLSVILVELLVGGIRRYYSQAEEQKFGPSPRRLIGSTPLIGGLLLFAVVAWGFASQPHVWGFFVPDEIVPYWREKQLNNKYGASLPWIIIPRAAQAEVVAYLRQLPPEANIYYPARHKTAEISVQVGKVLYPLNRRKFMKPYSQDVGLIGPSLIAPWLEPVRREALLNLVREECPQPVLSNDYYMICPFPVE
jgi:hypothetical protein